MTEQTEQTEPGPDDAEQQPEPEQTEPGPDDAEQQPEPEQFTRGYVTELRGESRRYRERAQSAETRAEALAAALWQANVAATGRLADPADLARPTDTDPTDTAAVAAAIDALLDAKPHLAARRAAGDIGQHDTRDDSGNTPNLAEMLRAGT